MEKTKIIADGLTLHFFGNLKHVMDKQQDNIDWAKVTSVEVREETEYEACGFDTQEEYDKWFEQERKKMQKEATMDLHHILVKRREYEQARKVLKLLRVGSIKLYNNDEDWAVSKQLEIIGFVPKDTSRKGLYSSYCMGRFE